MHGRELVVCVQSKRRRNMGLTLLSALRTLITRHTQKNTAIRTSGPDSDRRDGKFCRYRGSAVRAACASFIQDSTHRDCPILCSPMSVM
jgi:hypothetical protein